MRKYVRKMLKNQAQQQGIKVSKYVNWRFDKLQIKKYGKNKREINKVKGTHPRRLWKSRIKIFVV